MSVLHSEKTITCTPEQMYALVNDVAAYSEFLPWCVESVVHSQDDEHLEASLTIMVAGIKHTFTTHNRLQAGKTIEMHSEKEPFKYLNGCWGFHPIEQEGAAAPHCRVSLDLEFEFTNLLFKFTLAPFFHHISSTLVEAFCQRAKVLYGCTYD